ncbi:MAG: isoprenoid biosynthesis glyoxalase ElbB, partial [Crocinitomicaceae bacterium]
MKIGVLLSGCGVYDGAEIQEAVLTLLAIEEIDAEAICISIDKEQYHVVNHLNGQEMDESRNMLIESARIARGNIQDINNIDPADIDALVIPGGFGSAKNFTKWAFSGPEGDILPEVKLLLVNMINIGKPIAALCVSPVVMAKALEGSSINPNLTIGSKNDPSPYDIEEFS